VWQMMMMIKIGNTTQPFLIAFKRPLQWDTKTAKSLLKKDSPRHHSIDILLSV
jgi:hypothetical protein